MSDDEIRVEAERHQESELKRLRQEVLDIARELKGMQRLDTGRSGAAGFEGPRAREFGVRTEAPAVSRSVRPSQSQIRPPEPPPKPAQPNLRTSTADAKSKTAPARTKARPPSIVPDVRKPAKAPAARSKGFRVSLAAKIALLVVVMLAGTGLITTELWGGMPWLAPARQKVADLLVHVTWPVAKRAHAAPSAPVATARQMPAFATPDAYGVYALSDGQLTPLKALPVRIPDAHVSISGTISKPAPAPLANGRLSFVVYYRDLATSVPDTASVRAVAKVMQATVFTGGKPKSLAIEDSWAVRGGAIDLRIAPVPGNNEMIAIRTADPGFTLSPGRYVLMFKNQAYDFSVAGTVSDTAQCLDRADLPEGSVYSECRELPAQPISY